MMPSCDQIGVPIHFHSSTTCGSASLMSLRILRRVSPRQSPSSAILFEMSSDADWPWLAPDFFMLGSAMMANDDSTRHIAKSLYSRQVILREPGLATPSGLPVAWGRSWPELHRPHAR